MNITVKNLVDKGLNKNIAYGFLKGLHDLGLAGARSVPKKEGSRGKPEMIFELSPEVSGLVQKALDELAVRQAVVAETVTDTDVDTVATDDNDSVAVPQQMSM